MFVLYTYSVYCYKCIEDLASKNVREDIIQRESWLCFLCSENEKRRGMICPRPNWKENVSKVLLKYTFP